MEYIVKGFALDDECLAEPGGMDLAGTDHIVLCLYKHTDLR